MAYLRAKPFCHAFEYSLAFGTLSIPAAYALGKSMVVKPQAWDWSRRFSSPPIRRMSISAAWRCITSSILFLHCWLWQLLARALRRMRLADFALGGCVWAGIAQYFYHGSRLLPVLMLIYVLFHILYQKAQRHKDAENNQSSSSCLCAIVSLCYVVCHLSWSALPRFAPMLTSVDLPLTGNLNAIRLARRSRSKCSSLIISVGRTSRIFHRSG